MPKQFEAMRAELNRKWKVRKNRSSQDRVSVVEELLNRTRNKRAEFIQVNGDSAAS